MDSWQRKRTGRDIIDPHRRQVKPQAVGILKKLMGSTGVCCSNRNRSVTNDGIANEPQRFFSVKCFLVALAKEVMEPRCTERSITLPGCSRKVSARFRRLPSLVATTRLLLSFHLSDESMDFDLALDQQRIAVPDPYFLEQLFAFPLASCLDAPKITMKCGLKTNKDQN